MKLSDTNLKLAIQGFDIPLKEAEKVNEVLSKFQSHLDDSNPKHFKKYIQRLQRIIKAQGYSYDR